MQRTCAENHIRENIVQSKGKGAFITHLCHFFSSSYMGRLTSTSNL